MQTKLLINGQLIPGAGTPLPVMNPSTGGELIAIAEGIGRPARQRTTTYSTLAVCEEHSGGLSLTLPGS